MKTLKNVFLSLVFILSLLTSCQKEDLEPAAAAPLVPGGAVVSASTAGGVAAPLVPGGAIISASAVAAPLVPGGSVD